MNMIAKFFQFAQSLARQGAGFDDLTKSFRQTFNRDPQGMEVIGIRRAIRDAGEPERGQVIPFPQKRSFKEEIDAMETPEPISEEELFRVLKERQDETLRKMREKKGLPPKDGGE